MKSNTISTDQGHFKARVLGAKGDWVVCWPGQFNDHESMLDFAQALAPHYRVVLCDPPATGLNKQIPYTHAVADLVSYAQLLLDKLKIDTCHWIGHSAGGVVGAALRNASAHRIQTLTLASVPMLSQGRFQLHVAASTSLLAGSRFGRHILASRGTQEMGYANEQEKKLVAKYLRRVLERTHPQTIRAMRPLDGASVRRVFDKLRTNAPHILVLCGEHDSIVLPRDQRTVAEITQAQFASLRSGHMNLLVEPEACAHAFMRFIQAQESRPAALAA